MKVPKYAAIVLIVLLIGGGVMARKLATGEEPKITPPPPSEAAKNRILAKRELQAFTLLKDDDLEVRLASSGLDPSTPNQKALTDRYLLASVKRGAEVRDQMIAPREATPLLSDAVAISIPITPTTFPGGQLRAGDLVDLIAVRPQGSTGLKKFENLMVLSIVQANKDTTLPNAIALAVPSAQRDDFAASVAGAELLLTRKIVVAN